MPAYLSSVGCSATQQTHCSRAGIGISQGKLAEAGSLYKRKQAIDEKVCGPDHPELATDLNTRAVWLVGQVRNAKILEESLWTGGLEVHFKDIVLAVGSRCSTTAIGLSLQLVFTLAIRALDKVYQPFTSHVHRETTRRQFHSWRGPFPSS